MKIAIILLVLIIVILLTYIFGLKKQFKTVKSQLNKTKDDNYNKNVTISLMDNDLSDMVTAFNENLDYQKQLKLKAEQSEKNLKQSISDISHDLRTPLTVVNGNLQMLANAEGLTEENKNYIDISIRQTENLRDMVDNFFQLSVLESENVTADLKRIDLTQFVINFVIDHESIIRSNNLSPEINLPEKQVIVTADEKMLERILSNLLNNIIKYASEYFIISLIENEDKTVELSFSNKIEKNSELDAKKLFDRTYRGSKERKGNGAGLGLYIVKLLAERQNIGVDADIVKEEKKDDLLSIKLSFK